MRIVVMSDIHGNLAALQSFEKLQEKYDELYCLGDVVGYGPYPEECVQWTKEHASVVIQGNHERALFDPHERHVMNPLAAEQIRWTRRVLSPESLATIQMWPADAKKHGLWFCHGSPDDPDRYIFGPKEVALALYALEEAGIFIALFGHTHYPGLITEEGEYWYEIGKDKILEKGKRYLINPGSIGQPRDGDPRASCCILSHGRDGWKVRFLRFTYDIQSTVEGIMSKGLPVELAYRLGMGR
ncbi:metallophosphoesterase family protein [Thermospira aquatica]|nr:metallophosphoesterase family protein [Thermospira aquatica]